MQSPRINRPVRTESRKCLEMNLGKQQRQFQRAFFRIQLGVYAHHSRGNSKSLKGFRQHSAIIKLIFQDYSSYSVEGVFSK